MGIAKLFLQTSDTLNMTYLHVRTLVHNTKNTENETISNHYFDISYDKQTSFKIPFEHNGNNIDTQTKLTPD